MNIVQLRGISRKYGEKVVFQGVNLEIAAGFFVALRGESGAGKSTMLNLIGGLEEPSEGEIIVDEKNVSGMNVKERVDFYRHEIGIIFQGSYLQQQFSILENITLPGVFAGMAEAKRIERANQLAEMLGISESLKLLPSEVSGGQAERACIARALLLNPKIILADEPTNNLDEKNAQTVLGILDDVRRQMGVTVIIASHNREVVGFADQMITIEGGEVRNEIIKRGAEGSGAAQGENIEQEAGYDTQRNI